MGFLWSHSCRRSPRPPACLRLPKTKQRMYQKHVLEILNNEKLLVLKHRHVESMINVPNLLVNRSFINLTPLDSRHIFNQKNICHPYRNDHDGDVARGAHQRLRELIAADHAHQQFCKFAAHISEMYPKGRLLHINADGECSPLEAKFDKKLLSKSSPSSISRTAWP
jgi:hypothetical protein